MRDCEILVLDELTTGLDAENELQAFQQICKLTEDRMAFLISHRFSTVRMADRILVVGDGYISEEGTQGDLLGLDGTYARLLPMQAESHR